MYESTRRNYRPHHGFEVDRETRDPEHATLEAGVYLASDEYACSTESELNLDGGLFGGSAAAPTRD